MGYAHGRVEVVGAARDVVGFGGHSLGTNAQVHGVGCLQTTPTAAPCGGRLFLDGLPYGSTLIFSMLQTSTGRTRSVTLGMVSDLRYLVWVTVFSWWAKGRRLLRYIPLQFAGDPLTPSSPDADERSLKS